MSSMLHSRSESEDSEWTDDMIALFESVADELLLHKQREAAAKALNKTSRHGRIASQDEENGGEAPSFLITAAATGDPSNNNGALAMFAASEQATSSAIQEVCDDLVGRFLFNTTNGSGGEGTVSTADSIASLHDELRSCNRNLLSMQSFLEDFHDKIIEACDEINELRAHAKITKLKRDNRLAARAILGSVIDALVVPPDVVNILINSSTGSGGLDDAASATGVSSGTRTLLRFVAADETEELGAQFMEALRRLHGHVRQRLHMKEIVFGETGERDEDGETEASNSGAPSQHASPNVPTGSPFPISSASLHSSSPPGREAATIRLRKCKAFRDMTAFFADLLIFVCIRIRGFLASKVQALTNPRTNFVAKQEHVLRGYRLLFRFMRDATEYLRASVVLNPNEYKASALTLEDSRSSEGGSGGNFSSQRQPFGRPQPLHNRRSVHANDESQREEGHSQPKSYGAGSAIPVALLMGEQRKPFVPYRLVKALYEDLKNHYMVTLSRIYNDRIGRYIMALSSLELGNVDIVTSGGDGLGDGGGGSGGGGGASSWVGLTSLIWGSATATTGAANRAATSGPSYSEHLAQYQTRTQVPLLSHFVSRDTLNSEPNGPSGAAVFYSFQGKGRTVAAAAASSPPRSSASVTIPQPTGDTDWRLAPDQLAPFQLGARDAIFCRRKVHQTSSSEESQPPPPADPEGIFQTPIVPHLNRIRSQHHAYEETYRSLHVLLQDAVCHEYLFLLDVFGADSWEVAEGVFRSTFQLVVDHASDKMLLNRPRTDAQAQQRLLLKKRDGGSDAFDDVEGIASAPSAVDHDSMFFSPFEAGNKDLCGLLVLLRTTLILRTNMRYVRRVNFLDSLYASQIALLWPAIHSALGIQIGSLKSIGNAAPYNLLDGRGKRIPGRGAAEVGNNKAPLPPASSRSLRAVHPLAQGFVEISTTALQLLDLVYVWKAQRLQAIQLDITSRLEQEDNGAVGIGTVGDSSHTPTPTTTTHNDEFLTDVCEGVSVLRANLGVLRLEALRVLRLPSIPFLNYYYYVAFGSDPDQAPSPSNNVAASPGFSGVGLSNKNVWERRAMAAVAPYLNNLHYVVAAYELTLEGGAPRHSPLPRPVNHHSDNAQKQTLPSLKDPEAASDIREAYYRRKQQLIAAIPGGTITLCRGKVPRPLVTAHGLLRAEATLSYVGRYSCSGSYCPSYSSPGDSLGLPTGIEMEWSRLLLHATATACSKIPGTTEGGRHVDQREMHTNSSHLSTTQIHGMAEERALSLLNGGLQGGAAADDSHRSMLKCSTPTIEDVCSSPLTTVLAASDDYKSLLEELEDQRAIYARISVSVAFQEMCELLFRPVAILGPSPNQIGQDDSAIYHHPNSSPRREGSCYMQQPAPTTTMFLSRFRVDHLLEVLEDDSAYITELFLVTLAPSGATSGLSGGSGERLGDASFSESDGGEEDYESLPNVAAIFSALLRISMHCQVVVDVCAAFAASWETGVHTLQDLSHRYLVDPVEQQSSLAQSCLFLLTCNSTLHAALRLAMSITHRIRVAMGISPVSTHAFSRTLSPASSASRASSPLILEGDSPPHTPLQQHEVLPVPVSAPSAQSAVLKPLLAAVQVTQLAAALPPPTSSIRNLVVPNQLLLDTLRKIASVEVHDAHPTL